MKTHRRHLFTLALVLCACVAPPADPPGVAAGAIYQGVRETGEPWVVAVHYPKPEKPTTIRLCSGSVIAPRVVLTAKHCVHHDVGLEAWNPVAPADLTVTVGHDMTSAAGKVRELGVTEVVTTPGPYTHDDGLNGDDIALLKLDGDAGVVAKAVSVTAPAPGDTVLIAGFGFTEKDVLGQKFSGTATVNVLGLKTFETDGPAWTCTGDSGGPALHVTRDEVLGVTSVGPSGCKTPRSIYTRVDAHAELVAQALGLPPPAEEVADEAGPAPGEDPAMPAEPAVEAGPEEAAPEAVQADSTPDIAQDPAPAAVEDAPGSGGGGCGASRVPVFPIVPLLAGLAGLLLRRILM